MGHLIDELRRDFADLPEVLAHLDAVERDVVASADEFIAAAAMAGQTFAVAIHGVVAEAPTFRRYEVNVLVDHRATSGAPVVYEDNPTHANLVGRVEHVAAAGRAGHRLHAHQGRARCTAPTAATWCSTRARCCTQPFAWEALKRALRAGEIRIESLGQMLGLVSTARARARAHPARREGRAGRRPAALLPARRATTPTSASCSRWRPTSTSDIERDAGERPRSTRA